MWKYIHNLCEYLQTLARAMNHTIWLGLKYLRGLEVSPKNPDLECSQIEKYGSWLVEIFRKFIFTSLDLNEKPLLANFQQL